jgi:hypothetical protein
MSEQANNRRGAGWLGVGTLTAAEVNALSAAMAGPGTESNRERAGRGGPMGDDVLSAGKNGRDPDSEAKIHALALDVARAGICTYAEARAHVEAMLAPRMERLGAAQVREVFERVAGVDHARGPDFTALRRIHAGPDGRRHAIPLDATNGIRAWLVESQMGSTAGAPCAGTITIGIGYSAREVAVCTGDSPRMAGEMVERACADYVAGRAMAEPCSVPAPAPGQVWLPPPSVGWAEPDGTRRTSSTRPARM